MTVADIKTEAANVMARIGLRLANLTYPEWADAHTKVVSFAERVREEALGDGKIIGLTLAARAISDAQAMTGSAPDSPGDWVWRGLHAIEALKQQCLTKK